jgi:hypothetical protein
VATLDGSDRNVPETLSISSDDEDSKKDDSDEDMGEPELPEEELGKEFCE